MENKRRIYVSRIVYVVVLAQFLFANTHTQTHFKPLPENKSSNEMFNMRQAHSC